MSAATDMAAEYAQGLVSMAETLRPLLDAVDGHRNEALARGYSPTAAEQMALVYHQLLIAQLVAGASK